MCEFKKVDDVMLKIGVGVITAVLIAVIFFGVRVYAFMEAGDRFTPADGTAMYEKVEDHFVDAEVYERDLKYTREQLKRIEQKLDLLLMEK